MARSAKQRAALRKAQLASARKRRGKGKGKLARANRSVSRYKRTRNLLIGAAAVGGAAALGHHAYKKARHGTLGTTKAGRKKTLKSQQNYPRIHKPGRLQWGVNYGG